MNGFARLACVTAALATFSFSQTTHGVPVVVSGEMPLYPLLARQARIQGEVQLQVQTDGSLPVSVTVESGPPMLAKAAQENVKTWRFLKHDPTIFETHFSYILDSSSCEAGKPESARVLLELPSQVELKAP